MKTKKKAKEITLAISVPRGWGELTSAQVARVAAELLHSDNGTEMLVRLATEFAGLSPRGASFAADGSRLYHYYHRTTGNITLTAEQVANIVQTMEWLTLGNIAPMAAPVLDGCHTPDAKLRDITLEQFITADVAYGAYASGNDRQALRVLGAALYARAKYNPETLDKDAQRLARLDTQLYGVFLWFTGAKVHLGAQFPEVFGGESDSQEGAPSGGDYLLGLLSSLNGGDVTKNEQLKAMSLYEALYELENKIKAAQKDV